MTDATELPATIGTTHDAPSARDIEDLVREHMPMVGHLVRELLNRVPGHVHADDLSSAGFAASARLPRVAGAERGAGAGRGVGFAAARRTGAGWLAPTWKPLIRRVRSSASPASEWLAAVVSSTMAAFCWVTWSIWFTAELTSFSAVACSLAEAAISPTTAWISLT